MAFFKKNPNEVFYPDGLCVWNSSDRRGTFECHSE